MATALVVGRLGDLYLLAGDVPPQRFPIPPRRDPTDAEAIPVGLERAIRSLPEDSEVRADTPTRAALARSFGRARVEVASIAELRAARRRLPAPDPATERRVLLAVASATLERVLASPEEILISLAREDERLERAVGREARASEAFLAPAGSPLEEYARSWTEVRNVLERHRTALVERMRQQVREVVPNLGAVVGPTVAARLVAAAGGVGALARMRAPRIQLLGSRRRPSPERGPRYGAIYRADRMGDVPADRRGAYARSLAAIAAIAVRADALTHPDLARRLVARRDRRIEQLRRQGR